MGAKKNNKSHIHVNLLFFLSFWQSKRSNMVKTVKKIKIFLTYANDPLRNANVTLTIYRLNEKATAR